MTNKQLDQIIDKYVLNQITKDEQKQLDIELLVNPELEQTFKVRNDIAKGYEILGNEELKLILDKIHYQNISEAKSKDVKIKVLWIGISIFTILMSWLFLNKNVVFSNGQENMYAEYYEPYIPSISDRGIGFEQRISDFSKAYQNNNYKRALSIINPILAESSNEIKLIAGICSMEIENYEESKKLFTDILASKDYYFMDHAKWYLALSYIKQDKIVDAKQLLLELINDPDADHHSQAQTLWNKF